LESFLGKEKASQLTLTGENAMNAGKTVVERGVHFFSAQEIGKDKYAVFMQGPFDTPQEASNALAQHKAAAPKDAKIGVLHSHYTKFSDGSVEVKQEFYQ
jgi:hypothetical protein